MSSSCFTRVNNTFKSDSEYRLLRQHIFEQQITGTVIPVEVPIIPVVSPPACESFTFLALVWLNDLLPQPPGTGQ
jgi:hypothetical protein